MRERTLPTGYVLSVVNHYIIFLTLNGYVRTRIVNYTHRIPIIQKIYLFATTELTGALSVRSNKRLDMKDYGVFCKLKNCEEFIAWDCKFDSEAQPYPCESCKRVGQSYSVTEYPKDCNFLDEIQYIKSVFG